MFRQMAQTESPEGSTESSKERGMMMIFGRFEIPKLVPRCVMRTASRGVTLIEIMIVVAIMSLVATGVVVAVIPKFNEARVKTADQNARELRNAVMRWRATHAPDQCPSLSQLVQDKEVDSASVKEDPWGSPYKILCADDEVTIVSLGPDKKENTADDVSIPKAVGGH